jgi:trimethylamine:corrinoid methyltransferase-like protein
VKAGVPTGLTAMPVAGVTAPVTVEGFIVVASAEYIATWFPKFIERSGWNGFEKEEDILRKMQRKVNELIEEYKKPDVNKGKLAEMRKVVQRAKREIL